MRFDVPFQPGESIIIDCQERFAALGETISKNEKEENGETEKDNGKEQEDGDKSKHANSKENYDIQDPFIDDEELYEDEEQEIFVPITKGYFVYAGVVPAEPYEWPEEEEEEAEKIEEQQKQQTQQNDENLTQTPKKKKKPKPLPPLPTEEVQKLCSRFQKQVEEKFPNLQEKNKKLPSELKPFLNDFAKGVYQYHQSQEKIENLWKIYTTSPLWNHLKPFLHYKVATMKKLADQVLLPNWIQELEDALYAVYLKLRIEISKCFINSCEKFISLIFTFFEKKILEEKIEAVEKEENNEEDKKKKKVKFPIKKFIFSQQFKDTFSTLVRLENIRFEMKDRLINISKKPPTMTEKYPILLSFKQELSPDQFKKDLTQHLIEELFPDSFIFPSELSEAFEKKGKKLLEVHRKEILEYLSTETSYSEQIATDNINQLWLDFKSIVQKDWTDLVSASDLSKQIKMIEKKDKQPDSAVKKKPPAEKQKEKSTEESKDKGKEKSETVIVKSKEKTETKENVKRKEKENVNNKEKEKNGKVVNSKEKEKIDEVEEVKVVVQQQMPEMEQSKEIEKGKNFIEMLNFLKENDDEDDEIKKALETVEKKQKRKIKQAEEKKTKKTKPFLLPSLPSMLPVLPGNAVMTDMEKLNNALTSYQLYINQTSSFPRNSSGQPFTNTFPIQNLSPYAPIPPFAPIHQPSQKNDNSPKTYSPVKDDFKK